MESFRPWGELHQRGEQEISKKQSVSLYIRPQTVCNVLKAGSEKKRANNEFDLVKSVHESEHSRLKPDIESEHRLEVTLETDVFTEEKFNLFSNYQQHVHHEAEAETTRQGFKRFLCSSPLHRHNDLSPKKLGSFHQCYRFDGRLVAMSVLDLLPHAVSGVVSFIQSFGLGNLLTVYVSVLPISLRLRTVVIWQAQCVTGGSARSREWLPILLHGLLYSRLQEDAVQGRLPTAVCARLSRPDLGHLRR